MNILLRPLELQYIKASGLILGLRPANERQCYFVTTSLIGWVQAKSNPEALKF